MTDRDRALAALCDAFVPGDGDLPSASHLGVHRMLRAEVVALARPALVAELDQLLDTIESPILNVALTGRAVRFTTLGQAAREDYLKRWAASPLSLKRRAFQVMKRLVLLYTYGQDGSPYAALAGYVRPPLDRPADAVPLRARRVVAGETIEADVCVIGSGAGGGVVAAELAAAGKRVVVLERAPLRTEPDFDSRELAGYAALFVDRGIAATSDRRMALDGFTDARERLARDLAGKRGDLELRRATALLLRSRIIALAASHDRDLLARAAEELRPFSTDDPVAAEVLRRATLTRGAVDVKDLAP